MLELGIDEITLVLQLVPEKRSLLASVDWIDIAANLIEIFVRKSDFIHVFGEMEAEKKAPAGYTNACTFGQHPFYLAVAYHEYHISMGIVVKFSAQALDYYCESKNIKVYEFLQKVRDDMYTVRLSRVDLTADFFDEGINPTKIYDGLKAGKIGVFREFISKKTGEPCYRKTVSEFRGFAVEREVPTVYLGSVKSNSRLRIYDKKREQLERKGTKLDKARQCKDWVRFEGTFKNEFSHQLTEALINIKNDDEFADLIASTLVQKFRLMYVDNGVVDCDTEYTQMLMDCITVGNFALRAPSSRNYDLSKNVMYLFRGSGLISILFKIKSIWGEEAITKVLDAILDYMSKWEANDDCKHWIKAYSDDYKKGHPNFDLFLSASLAPIDLPTEMDIYAEDEESERAVDNATELLRKEKAKRINYALKNNLVDPASLSATPIIGT